MKRRTLLGAAALAPIAVKAQGSWPSRALRMIIPWPPGQATDLAGRLIAQKLSEILGQNVVPENRAGAGGTIGVDAGAKAAPDGYTLLAASSGPVTISPLLQRVPFDPERDLAPVAFVDDHDLSGEAWQPPPQEIVVQYRVVVLLRIGHPRHGVHAWQQVLHALAVREFDGVHVRQVEHRHVREA